ncbi:MAG: putative bifunctional diguanylate cyclase/phosphodiesterase [Thiobacillus sp.]
MTSTDAFTPPPAIPAAAARGDVSHIDRLTALWKLSAQRGLSDEARIRAMLAMAAEVLDMDLVLLGEFGDQYTARYVFDRLGVFPEGTVLAVENVMCRDVHLSREPMHIPDLRKHGQYAGHPTVMHLGLLNYSGLPITVGNETGWVLAFLRRQARPAVDPVDIAYMELIADWLGNALYQSAQHELLQRMALTDALTGLPNRRAAEERLHTEKARAPRDRCGFALALVDIDHFKSINDRYGHAVGDEVLAATARRFEQGLREGDWVARWGGEEFLFVLHGCTAEDAGNIIERMAGLCRSTPVQTSVGDITLSFSAGVAAFGPDEADTAMLIDAIDQALYRAKSEGRNKVRLVERDNRALNAGQLRQAIASGGIRVAMQIIVDLETGAAVADEALARICLNSGEVVEAGRFVEQAEGLGLMAEIDRQIIHQTMHRCGMRISAGGATDYAHFVNVSPQFLARRDLVDEMFARATNYCATCGIGPVKPMVLELTERQRIVSIERLRADLQPFIDFGFRLALDDFGSGYSSYLYLANLPVSFLKIEGWLIAHMRGDRKVAGIVESLASFARKEGVLTVAEHVEDAETARILADMGVNYAQGWHFGRPILV